MSYKDPVIFLSDCEDEPPKVLLSDFEDLEKSKNDPFLDEAIKALSWQGGTRNQILRIISAARDIHCERKTALLTCEFDKFQMALAILDECFNT